MKKLGNKFLLAACLFLTLGCVASCRPTEDDDNTLMVFRWDFAAVDSARKQKTPIYQEIKRNTDVDIRVVTSGSGTWEEVLNRKFNTGDLPDIFISYAMDRPTSFRKWIEDGAVLAISDYVNESTKNEYPKLYERIQNYKYIGERLSYAKGKTYALPVEKTLEHGMFIRTDWIRNLNEPAKLTMILTEELGRAPFDHELESMRFKIPTTLIEFYRLTRAFSKYDPDGNGRNDTYGYTCSEFNMWFNNWIFEAMSSADIHDSTYWGYVEDGTGNLTSSWITEGNKKAVAFLNKLYAESILDPDYIATTTDEKITKFVQGKVGIMVGNIWYNTILQKFVDANSVSKEQAKQDFTVIAPPAGPNGVFGMRGNPGFWCSVCINGQLSNHKRKLALGLMEYLYSDAADELFTWGIEGVHYELDGDKKVSLMGVDKSGYNYTIESYDAAFALSSLSKWSYSYYSPYQSNYEDIYQFMENASAYEKIDPVMYVQTPLYVERDTIIANSSLEQFVNFIKDSSCYDSSSKQVGVTWGDLYKYNATYNQKWDAFLNLFNNTWGGAEMVAEYNETAKQYL
ncbi:MAG: Lipoprotein LipO precursor [Tenericutes bacterium ADurb.Bin239]|nr:MAG: Lipoprotein LipO precursor [Tenericutes bacterium ADurb.Bin239]